MVNTKRLGTASQEGGASAALKETPSEDRGERRAWGKAHAVPPGGIGKHDLSSEQRPGSCVVSSLWPYGGRAHTQSHVGLTAEVCTAPFGPCVEKLHIKLN